MRNMTNLSITKKEVHGKSIIVSAEENQEMTQSSTTDGESLSLSIETTSTSNQEIHKEIKST